MESVVGLYDCALRASAAYREINQDVPGDLEALIQNFMCESLPDGFCTGHPSAPSPTWTSVLQATQSMLASAKRLGTSGPQLMQVVESRVSACQACKQHILGMCVSCNGLLAAFEEFRRTRRTSMDRNVRVCGVSHGLLPFIIHIGAEQVRALPGTRFPDSCWVSKELAT